MIWSFSPVKKIEHAYHVKYKNADENGFIPLDVTNPNNPLWLRNEISRG